MDLRRVVQGIMTNYGEEVILYRRCRCGTEGPYATIVKCAECHGSGYLLTAERHKARRMQATSADQAAAIVPEGISQDDNNIFWFKYNVNPSEGDLIVVDDPSSYKGKVGYEITDAIPYRMNKGRIEYWAVGTKRKFPR